MRVGLAIERERVSAVAMKRGRTLWAAEATYAGADDLERALGELAAECPRGSKVAAVGLSADLARVKTVAGLPRVRRDVLAAHVKLNARRYFLQNGVPLVTDAVLIAAKGDDSGSALLAAAPVPIIDAIARGLLAAGLTCDTITPLSLLAVPAPGDDAFAAARAVARARIFPLTLVPDAARAERLAGNRRSVLRWAWGAAGALTLTALTWFAVQARRERAATAELTRVRLPLQAALATRADLDGATDALDVLARIAQGRSHRARFLADLTRALPDSSFVVSVRLEPDGRGSLAGYAPSAAQIVSRLERAGLVRRAALDGPVTREVLAGREWERFAIRFDLAAARGTP